MLNLRVLVLLVICGAASAQMVVELNDIEPFDTLIRMLHLPPPCVSLDDCSHAVEHHDEGTGVIGGSRDISLSIINPAGASDISHASFVPRVYEGEETHHAGAHVHIAGLMQQATFLYQLDGNDGSMHLDKTGLGGTSFFVDGGATGIFISCLCDIGGTMKLRFYDMNGRVASFSGQLPANNEISLDFIAHDDFTVQSGAYFNWGSIGAFEMEVLGGWTQDFRLFQLTTAARS